MRACIKLQSFFKLFYRNGSYRRRKIQKACYDARITILGGMMTFLFLRSCLGGGQFRTPMDDIQVLQRGRRELYNAMSNQMKETLTNNTIDGTKEKMAYFDTGQQLSHAENNVTNVSKASLISLNTNNSFNTELGFNNTDHYTPDLGFNNTAIAVLGSPKFTSNRSQTEFGSTMTANTDQLGSNITELGSKISVNYGKLGFNVRSNYSESSSNLSSELGDHKAKDLTPRSSSLQANPAKPHVLLVTATSLASPCSHSNTDQEHDYNVQIRSVKNKIEYCRLHGIEMLYRNNMAHMGSSQKPNCWDKLSFIRKVMTSNPDAGWIWWVDSDAIIFTNMSMELPIDKYASYNMVFYGWDEQLEGGLTDLTGGSFLIRSCQWSLDLLNQLLSSELRAQYEGHDQSLFMGFFIREWGSKVYLESAYDFLYRVWNVSERDHMGDSQYMGNGSWPLMSHFVGCSKQDCDDKYEANKLCVHEMQVAFTVGDNQAVKIQTLL